MMRHGWGVFCALLFCASWLLSQIPAAGAMVDHAGDGTQFSNVVITANSRRQQALVVWLATSSDGHSQVRARGYRLNGAPVTDALTVAARTPSFEMEKLASAHDPQRDRYGVVYPVSPAGATPKQYELWGRWVSIQAGNLVVSEEVHLVGDAAGWANIPELVFDPSSKSFLLAYNSYSGAISAVKVIRLDGETMQPVGSAILVENTKTESIGWHTLNNGDHLLGYLNQDQIVIRRVNSDLTMGVRQAFQAKPLKAVLPANGPFPLVVWENLDRDIQYARLDDEGAASVPVTLRAHIDGTAQQMLPAVGYDPGWGMLVTWVEYTMDIRRLWSTYLSPNMPVPVQPNLVDANIGLSNEQAPGVGCFPNGGCLVGVIYDLPGGESWVELRRLGNYWGWIPFVVR